MAIAGSLLVLYPTAQLRGCPYFAEQFAYLIQLAKRFFAVFLISRARSPRVPPREFLHASELVELAQDNLITWTYYIAARIKRIGATPGSGRNVETIKKTSKETFYANWINKRTARRIRAATELPCG
jgi:hypothetical protein